APRYPSSPQSASAEIFSSLGMLLTTGNGAARSDASSPSSSTGSRMEAPKETAGRAPTASQTGSRPTTASHAQKVGRTTPGPGGRPAAAGPAPSATAGAPTAQQT